jgi:ABC-type branched-subunit amino acid transport system substrate-binding protein
MRWIVAVLGASMVVAACSSSSKTPTATTAATATTAGGTPTTAAATPTTAALTGPAIKLGLMTGIQTSGISQPWVAEAAKIGAAAVNAAGGVMGHPVEMDVCDDHSTPQGASLCAQKLLVEDKVLMMVGDDGTQEPSLIPTLATANTISFASLGASLDSIRSKRVYILEPLIGGFILPRMLPPTTKKIAVVIADTAIARGTVALNNSFIPKSIATTTIVVPITATDFQPYCLEIKQSGADTAEPNINSAQIATMIQTCNQIGLTSLRWAMLGITLTPQTVQTVSQLNQPNTVVMSFNTNTIDAFNADIAKYGPQVGGITNSFADGSINAWLGVKLVPKVVQGAGAIDGAAIKTWLDQQTAFDTGGATPPINIASPNPAVPALFVGVHNASGYEGEIRGGKLVQVVATPFIPGKPNS